MRAPLALVLLGLALLAGCGSRGAPGGVGAMRLARVAHTQTRLPDGRVLLAGGLQDVKTVLPPGNNDVELFDPATGGFTVVARMTAVRATHTATLLADGRVVLIGGSPGTSVDVFNPATRSVEPGGDILGVRGIHTATLLADGRILLVGGMKETVIYQGGKLNEERRSLRSIEIYDPRTKSSRMLASELRYPRRGHTSTLLADGKVLVIGGTWAKPTEVIDAAKETVAPGPALNAARDDHQTTRLADGRLLVTGGSGPGGKSLDLAEIYDPKTNAFRLLAAKMVRAREDHTADLLGDGRVLITGGEDNQAGPGGRDIVLDDVEVFDPKTESFTRLRPLTVPRDDHRSTVLSAGAVLITGGEDDNDAGIRTAEIIVVPKAGANPR